MPRCEMCGEWPNCPWKTDPDILCGEFHPKPQTNADRIRQMSDEQLANVMASVETGVNTYGDDVYSHWLSWLKSPVEEVRDGT